MTSDVLIDIAPGLMEEDIERPECMRDGSGMRMGMDQMMQLPAWNETSCEMAGCDWENNTCLEPGMFLIQLAELVSKILPPYFPKN